MNVVCILHRYMRADGKTWYVDYAFNSYFTRKIKQNAVKLHSSRNWTSVLFHLNIRTFDIRNFTWIAEL